MGTRHLIKVVSNKETKIAQYGQWDGYPDGQGETCHKFINLLKESDNLKLLKDKLNNVRFIDSEKDKDFLESYDKNAPKWSNEPDNRTEEQKKWFDTYMSRNLGAEILNNIFNSADEKIILKDSSDFFEDGSFCEWAYILDLDKEVLEVYQPPTLKKSYGFKDFPTYEKFLEDFREEEDEE